MKIFTNKKITIVLLIVVILFNFILPTVSNANKAVEQIAGGLFLGIAKFLRQVADLVIEELQKDFMGEEFGVESIGGYYIDIGKGTPRIMYSPGVIFSGKVPALDINFFNPGANLDVKKKEYIVHASSYDYESAVRKAIPVIFDYCGYVAEEKIKEEVKNEINSICNDLGTVEPEQKGGFPHEYSTYTIDGKKYMLAENGSSNNYSFILAPEDRWSEIKGGMTEEEIKGLNIDGFAYMSTMCTNALVYNSENGYYYPKKNSEGGLNVNINEAIKDFKAKINAYFSEEDIWGSEEGKELQALFNENKVKLSGASAHQTVFFDFRGTKIYINEEADRGHDRSIRWRFKIYCF